MTIGSLVGRDGAQRPLQTVLERARAGAGGLVLVTGEAGIGKSALVNAVLALARDAGALVATGTCWEGEGAPGYWPWTQVVRALRLSADPDSWDVAAREAGAGLNRLLGATGPVGTEAGVFDVTDATNTALQVLARRQLLVVAIDDLHWADEASVALLGSLAGPAALSPILLIGTFHDDEVAVADQQLHKVLDRLSARATSVHLTGLDLSACTELLGRRVSPGNSTVISPEEVHRRTGGNPLFVQQLAQLWETSGNTGATPSGVEAAIERRLARLPTNVADLLARASLLGQRFSSRLLAAVAGRGLDEVDALLEAAQAAALVVHESEADRGRWRFVHDLVREVLQSALPVADRRQIHAAAARALQIAPEASTTVAATELAHHAVLAVPEISSDEATALLLEAAADASGRLAAAEAAGHLERALVHLDAADPQRLAVVEQLAREQLRAGLLEASRATFGRLLGDAAAADDAAFYARATLGLHELGGPIDPVDRPVHLVEARDRLGRDTNLSAHERDALTARVIGALVRHRAHRTEIDRSGMGENSADAVELARRSGDPAALSFALLARHDAIWEPATAVDRLELSLEMAGAARAGADPAMELQALLLEFVARLELGQDAALRTIERYWALEAQLLFPRCRYVALTRRVTVALMQGRFDDAERYLGEAYALGERIGEVDRDGVDCDQRWELARQRGDLAAMDDLVVRFGGDPHFIVIEVALALDRCDRVETERLYRRFHELGVVWPRWAQLIWWTVEAEVAVASGNDERCRAIRALLAPFADRWVVLGGGVVAHGPVAHFLSMLDAALGDLDAAVLGFERARMSAERLGARPWVVHARAGLARTLLARDAPGDRADARAALAAAADEAAGLGMAAVEVGALTDAEPAGSSPARFVRDDDVWTLTFDGTTVRLPDAKGLRDIHMLIRHAGADISALQLLAPDAGEVVAAARQLSADAVLDETARREYRTRLADLDERIADALDRHDDRRAQRLDAERDALLAELQAATGLGGRQRRLGDEAERARKAVTARVRDAVRRVGDRHPALGRHLAAAVLTGSSCRYAPKEPIRWET